MEEKNLANSIKAYRSKHGIRQVDLAKKLNLSIRTLAQIEQGTTRKLRPKTILALNSILETKLDFDISNLNSITRTRLQLGLSQQQLSDKSGVEPHLIHTLETRKTKK